MAVQKVVEGWDGNVLVVSHERSGTHFAMNTLAANFGYAASPWYNFDLPDLNINFHRASTVRYVLAELRDTPIPVMKSHHAAGFFPPGSLAGYKVIYLARHPAKVFPSFRELLIEYPWREGPEEESVEALMRATPNGRCCRFQWEPAATMLERWLHHVAGWRDRAQTPPEGERILFLRYEDLDRDFAATVARLADFVKKPLPGSAPERPSPLSNTVLPTATPGSRAGWTEACDALVAGNPLVREIWPADGPQGQISS